MLPCVDPLVMAVFPEEFQGIVPNGLGRCEGVTPPGGSIRRGGDEFLQEDLFPAAAGTRASVTESHKGQLPVVTISPEKLQITRGIPL